MPDTLDTADLPTTLVLLEQMTAQGPDAVRAARQARLPIYRAFIESPKFARMGTADVSALQLKRWILQDWLAQQ